MLTDADYAKELAVMTNDALFAEAKSVLWASAYAVCNPRAPAHRQVEVLYEECKRRNRMDLYVAANRP